MRCHVGIHVDFTSFTYSSDPSSVVRSELGLALPFPSESAQSVMVTGSRAHVTREPYEVSQLPPTWQFAFKKYFFSCFSPCIVEYQALVPGSIETAFIVPCQCTLLPSRSQR